MLNIYRCKGININGGMQSIVRGGKFEPPCSPSLIEEVKRECLD